MKNYSDCVALEYFVKVTPDSLLNLKIDDTLLDKSFQIGNYQLKVAENFDVRRPANSRHQTYKIIHLNNKSLKEVGVFKIWNNSIKEAINSKIRERNELVLMHDDMKSNLAFGSLYIDSLSGFVFSNFKPISNGSQFIQLITFFFIQLVLISKSIVNL